MLQLVPEHIFGAQAWMMSATTGPNVLPESWLIPYNDLAPPTLVSVPVSSITRQFCCPAPSPQEKLNRILCKVQSASLLSDSMLHSSVCKKKKKKHHRLYRANNGITSLQGPDSLERSKSRLQTRSWEQIPCVACPAGTLLSFKCPKKGGRFLKFELRSEPARTCWRYIKKGN